MNSPHLPPIQNILTRGTPLSSSLNHIQEGIRGILDDDHVPDQNTCIENFTLLTEAIVKKSQAIKYDYSDYRERSELSREILQTVFVEKILSDPPIKIPYEALLESIKYPEIIKDRLWEEYFEDLALQLHGAVPQDNRLTLDLDKLKLKRKYGFLETVFSLSPEIKHVRIGFVRQVKEKQKLTTVFRAFGEVTHIDFEHSGLLWLKKETLKSIFSHLGKVKTLNLRGNALNMLDQDELSAIFDPLFSLSSINLSTNGIDTFDEKKLAFLFSYFDAITSINLSCSLGTMNEKRLDLIFQHLHSLRHLELYSSGLCALNEARIHTIFSHLPHLKSIDLRYNSLENLDETCLELMFSYFSGVKRIDLSENDMGLISSSCLDRMFSHLRNIRHIRITESNRWIEDLTTRLPHLKGKIKQMS